MSGKELKKQLACVFDDNLHTKIWHNIADWTIIALIIVSTIEVFLSTFSGLTNRIGWLLRLIDVFTTVIFSIEVSLRIWTADLLDSKYAGFKGRIRYCFSFYGLLDIVSTYPAFFGLFFPIPAAFLKVFRTARLLRVFRYMKSFRILGEAISSKKQELGISLAFLSILTVILSFLLYFAEHDAQPELCENGWQTLVWAFAKYLGDPGKIADFPLLTFWGHFIAAIVGILGIAIFAVPAGLIGSGFVEVIEARKHEQEIADNAESIRRALRWEKDTHHTKLFLVPPYKPLGTLLTKRYLNESAVLEAVEHSSNLHLFNLASAFNDQETPPDNVVVVGCCCNTTYGCCIDRESKVTIVGTSGTTEPISNWVAYHIAKIGGFNYVSRELETDRDNPVSYYNIPSVDACPNIGAYLSDIDRLSSLHDSWVIPVCGATGPQSREHKIHICHEQALESNPAFNGLVKDLSEVMERDFSLKTDCNEYYKVGKQSILRHIACKNAFALRFECAELYFAEDRVARIKAIADVLNRAFEAGIEKALPPEMVDRPKECFGFEDYLN